MIKVSIFLFFCFVAIVKGTLHGILWSKKGADAYSWNEHIVLWVDASLTFLAVYFGYFYAQNLSFWSLSLLSAAGGFVYMALHPSFYYLSRHQIDGAYDGPFDEPSEGSTAWLNFPTWARVVFLVVAIVILIIAL